MNKQRKVTVCDCCIRACCWQGEFYCDEYKIAGTMEKTIEQLEQMRREDPQYWEENRGTNTSRITGMDGK